MVECPICKSMCFDDMEVCYGCIHRFDRGYVFSDGLMSSGLPDFEVEEPKPIPTSVVSPTLPTSLVFPVDAQGYNLVISVQPVKKEEEDVWRSSMRKTSRTQGETQTTAEVAESVPLPDIEEDAQDVLDEEEALKALVMDGIFDQDARSLTYA